VQPEFQCFTHAVVEDIALQQVQPFGSQTLKLLNNKLTEPSDFEENQQVRTKRDKSDSPSLLSFNSQFGVINHRLHDISMTLALPTPSVSAIATTGEALVLDARLALQWH
jgi:hypothetical protein